ncbi:MAG: hemerythrin domain-containing protein [Pseudomonadota bacterium]
MVEKKGGGQMTLLEKLRRDHINLKRLLALLSRELDAFFSGQESNFDLKIELLDYIEHYAEQVHHPTEDLIYQAALPKVGEGEKLLQRLSREHGNLVGSARRFRSTLEGIVQGEVMSRDEVETRGREFIALQRQHIDLEEHEVFPLLESLLTDEQWAEIASKAPKAEDPVFNWQDYNRFSSLIDYLQTHNSE